MTTPKHYRTANLPNNYPEFENIDEMISFDSLFVVQELELEKIVREVMKK